MDLKDDKPIKVAHLTPGSGNAFYCQNCVRDGGMLRALNGTKEVETLLVPIYLPPPADSLSGDAVAEGPLFFGAVNLYVKHKFPMFKSPRGIFSAMLNSKAALSFASKRAGTARSSGLEEITLSMLEGNSDFFKYEASRVVRWLAREFKPDIIHLSNALLSGFAPYMREALGVPVVCTLQDEDTWIAEMDEPYRSEAWKILAANKEYIDRFFPVSSWYKTMMGAKLGIPEKKLEVVPVGIDLTPYSSLIPRVKTEGPPTIGFLSRLSPQFGLDVLAEAYLRLLQTDTGKGSILKITGGYTKDDYRFLKTLVRRIRREGGALEIRKRFGAAERAAFLSSLSLLSVPAPKPEAYGLFQIEAMAAGVPLILPDHGGYGEIMRASGAGVLLDTPSPEGLAAAMENLLSSPETMKSLGEKGKEAAFRLYSAETMAKKLLKAYREII